MLTTFDQDELVFQALHAVRTGTSARQPARRN